MRQGGGRRRRACQLRASLPFSPGKSMRHSFLASTWRQGGAFCGGAVCQVGCISPLLAMRSCQPPP